MRYEVRVRTGNRATLPGRLRLIARESRAKGAGGKVSVTRPRDVLLTARVETSNVGAVTCIVLYLVHKGFHFDVRVTG